jgi:hypothetical protein
MACGKCARIQGRCVESKTQIETTTMPNCDFYDLETTQLCPKSSNVVVFDMLTYMVSHDYDYMTKCNTTNYL